MHNLCKQHVFGIMFLIISVRTTNARENATTDYPIKILTNEGGFLLDDPHSFFSEYFIPITFKLSSEGSQFLDICPSQIDEAIAMYDDSFAGEFHSKLSDLRSLEGGTCDVDNWLESINPQELEPVIEICHSEDTPNKVISPAKFFEALGQVEKVLVAKGFQLSIPKDQLHHYYTLPLASFSSLEIKIWIPFWKAKPPSEFVLKRIKILEFSSKNCKKTVCSLALKPSFVIVRNGRYFPIPTGQYDGCLGINNLCHISKHAQSLLVEDKCLTATNNPDTLTSEIDTDLCPSTCKVTKSMKTLVIGNDLYITAGQTDSEFFELLCKNSSLNTVFKPPYYGAVQIPMPCECEVLDNRGYLVHETKSHENCEVDKIPKIHIVIPLTMARFEPPWKISEVGNISFVFVEEPTDKVSEPIPISTLFSEVLINLFFCALIIINCIVFINFW